MGIIIDNQLNKNKKTVSYLCLEPLALAARPFGFRNLHFFILKVAFSKVYGRFFY